jgi:fructosamine-3-kinase
MPAATIQKYLNQFVSKKLGLQISSSQFDSIGGGCINETYRVTINGNIEFFLKLNSIKKYPGLFGKEKNGLEFLGSKKIIRVPAVIAHDEIDDCQILLLDWIEHGTKTGEFWKQFGEQLAALHQQTWLDQTGQSLFGLAEDNFIGSLPQFNNQQHNWIEFFIHFRLKPQIQIARNSHLLETKHLTAFENLYLKLSEIFNDENSSLLHGDLWSGNFMCSQNSEPVLIDPAVYFGHRSIDLAMTTLFGGFDKQFYTSYNYHYPFPKNYEEQWRICNLYPLLIHLNLFGSGYLSQIENVIRQFR